LQVVTCEGEPDQPVRLINHPKGIPLVAPPWHPVDMVLRRQLICGLVLAVPLLGEVPPAAVVDEVGLPRVLLIGDHGWGPRSGSATHGYTAGVRRHLAGRANVHRVDDAGVTTRKALERIESWLGAEPWAVIHFSFGFHDAKQDRRGNVAVPLVEFEENLRRIVERLQATGARLIWATATPVAAGDGRRENTTLALYNEAAARVMEGRPIGLNDLYALVLPDLAELLVPGTPHFNERGAERVAAEVARRLANALAAGPATAGESTAEPR